MIQGEYRPLGSPVKEEHVGSRIDGYLSNLYPFYSRAGWQKRMKTGDVLVDGKAVRSSYRVKLGEEVTLYHPKCLEPEVDRDIYPLWKKGDVMAVFKPGNLPMHESGPYRKNTFAHIVKEELGEKWAAVHRLDRETSGIVLCGSTYDVRLDLSRSLAHRVLQKEYVFITKAIPEKESFVEYGPIGDLVQSEIRIKKWVVEDGLPSETRFKLLETRGEYSLIRAYPKTGRTNQIRIHAAVNGLPLVGDKLYHPNEEVFLNWFENGDSDWVHEQTGFKRCLLHATALSFRHPADESICEIRCPIPDDMQNFWDSLL